MAAALSLSLLLCVVGVAASPQTVLLWPSGAPGSEGRTEAETVRITDLGEHVVSNVHAPSIRVFLPLHDKATGAAARSPLGRRGFWNGWISKDSRSSAK
jgi:hypothetical protein